MEIVEGKDMNAYLLDIRFGPPANIFRVKSIGKQIISAIKYLHENHIIHQDLKPLNLVFSKDYSQIKLIDLGLSHNSFQNFYKTRSADQGTPWYYSPEQIQGIMTDKIDVW